MGETVERAVSVALVPLSSEHADTLQRFAEDPAIGATTNLPEPYPPDGAASFILETTARRAEGREHTFAIFVGPALVGVCGLLAQPGRIRTAELGYWIGRPFWGQGYATAAARQIVAHGFRDLGFGVLTASCLVRNPASLRVLEKVGFRVARLGPSPHPKWRPDEIFAFYELKRATWEATAGLP